MASNKPKTSAPTETQGGFNDFTLVSKFTYGYRNREDITTLPPGVLVAGSQNVLTNTFQRVGIRKGYTLDGQANTDLAPIASAFDWVTNGGFENHLRSGFLTSAGNDGKLQTRFTHPDGTIEWVDVLTGLTNVDFNYTQWWNNSKLTTEVLLVNGDGTIYEIFGSEPTTLLSAANPTGIVGTINRTPNTQIPPLDSGGVDYVVGDVLTLAGGSGTAKITVKTIALGAIRTFSINNAGTGYVIGDGISLTGAGTNPFAHFTVSSVGGGGTVTGLNMIVNGNGYSVATGIATATGGVGTGLTLNVTSTGNGVESWDFVSDAEHGTGYSTGLVNTTGGAGTNAVVSIESVTSGSITKTGTASWQDAGFLVSDSAFGDTTLRVIINGTTYSYNNFDVVFGDTTTLYGVTPDPSGEASGSAVIQSPVANPLTSHGFTSNFTPNLISTIDQRVFLGVAPTSSSVLARGTIFVSKVNDFLTYGEGTSGAVGDPFEIITTSPPTAFIPQEEFMYISAGHDEWYNVSFTLSSDLESESVKINRLNTTPQQASQSQAMTNKIANSIVFLSFEPIINTFGRVDNILLTPQMTDLSYPIVNDMNSYDFTNACLFYYRKFVYVAVPREGLVLIYNMTDVNNPYWEAPQVLPISRFSIIDGELYGHSSQVSESYKLFDGVNDNSFPILAKATFSFNNYGTRSQSKGYNEFYVEGYISANTQLTLGVQYDIDGCATKTSFAIEGDDTQIVCISSDTASLGKTPLGKNPLGGALTTSNTTPKFRVIKTFPIRYFYEDQISFSSEDIDEQWEILAFGPQLLQGGSLNNEITQ